MCSPWIQPWSWNWKNTEAEWCDPQWTTMKVKCGNIFKCVLSTAWNCNSQTELLKVGISKMGANPGTAWITISILELHHMWRLNVAHCWNFTLFPQFCNTFKGNRYYKGKNAQLLLLAVLEVGMSFVKETKKNNTQPDCFAFSSVLLLWHLNSTDQNTGSNTLVSFHTVIQPTLHSQI